MKITNNTKYDTFYLRKLFLACEKHIFQTYLIHGESKHRCVTVKYHKGRNNHGVGGYAWYNSNSITITLPRIRKEFTTMYVKARNVAQTYLHEVGHNIGLRHKQMGKFYNIDVSWLPDEILPLKKPKPTKPKPNIVEVRAAKAQKKLDEWQSKLKRAKTYVKKYQHKVKYYEKKLAALPK